MTIAVVLMLTVRGAALSATKQPFADDPDAYRALAETFAETGVFGLRDSDSAPHPTAFRPPFYPWLLSRLTVSGKLSVQRVGLLHLSLAAIMGLFVFDTARRLTAGVGLGGTRFGPSRLALAACLLVAIDPILLGQSTQIMTETPAACLAAAVAWSWVSWINSDSRFCFFVALTLGLFLALAYLCRPPFLAWAILILAAMPLAASTKCHRRSAILTAVIVSSAVLGWSDRNSRVMGHPIWATSHGGYTLLLANNESFYDYLREGELGSVWDAGSFLNAYEHRYDGDPREAAFWSRDWPDAPKAIPDVGEHEDDRLCAQAAVATIRRRPKMFLWSAVVRVGRLWSPFPHNVADRSNLAVIAVGFFYLVLYSTMSLAVFWHRRVVFRRQWWALWLLVITLTAVHAVYWSNLRMRAPAIPAIAILSVLVVVRSGSKSPVAHAPPHWIDR